MAGAPVGTRLQLKVSPKASRNAVTGWMGDTLKLSVTAPPERGKANAAVVDLLAEALGIRKSQLAIERGATDARKVIVIEGLPAGEILRRLRKSGA